MKKLLLALLFVATSLCVSMFAMGQDFTSLRERAEESVKSRRPDWKLTRKEEQDKQVVYNWNSAEDGIRLLIFYGASEEEASERMQSTIKFLPAGPGRKRADIGDEAYSWKDDRKGFAGVRFRKGNVYIDLVASSEDVAEDLARDLARFIKKK